MRSDKTIADDQTQGGSRGGRCIAWNSYAENLVANLTANERLIKSWLLHGILWIRQKPEVTIAANRLHPVVLGKLKPRDRSVSVRPATIRKLHAMRGPLSVLSSSPDWTVIELFLPERFKDWFETAMWSELRDLHAMAMA